MIEMMARETARKVCAVIKEDSKKTICVELLTKILVQGESVKDEVREEIRKVFTEEERKLMKEELARLMG
ncbi:MAG: hypothetical protein QXG58_06330 [Candidatus Bathyarchaeia archaeon]